MMYSRALKNIKFKFVVTYCVALIALAPSMSSAQEAETSTKPLKLEITEGVIEPMPIAIPDFQESGNEIQGLGQRISNVVAANLVNSGLFRSLDKRAFFSQDANFDSLPQFENWRIINAQALVTGRVIMENDGRLRVQFRLWDVFAGSQLEGLQFYAAPENWRRVAHKVSDAIYSRLTGETGYFDTRIVFVQEAGGKEQRIKRLAIMDQDGENVRFLTDGSALALTPRFSPTDQEITYISYQGKTPQVYLLNLTTGQQEILGRFPGMTFAPRFSPDGRQVVLSMTQDGNTDIYIMDLATRNMRRLTTNSAIDTSPDFSPDGSQIVFESDRGGSQQLYIMSANGGDTTRISFGKGRYATPVWSPRGDTIAFTKMGGGEFSIGVMRTDGSNEKILSSSFLDEGPTWAPNGRVLMFFRETPGAQGGANLYSVDITGRNLKRVGTPGYASDPAWSPLLD